MFTMFTDVINEGRSRVIFLWTSRQSALFLQPDESPPDGHSRECMFQGAPHWGYLSELKVAAGFQLVICWMCKWTNCFTSLCIDVPNETTGSTSGVNSTTSGGSGMTQIWRVEMDLCVCVWSRDLDETTHICHPVCAWTLSTEIYVFVWLSVSVCVCVCSLLSSTTACPKPGVKLNKVVCYCMFDGCVCVCV